MTKVKCSHSEVCYEEYKKECDHAEPHTPGVWNKGDNDGLCNKVPVTCNAGSEGDVLCIKEGQSYYGGTPGDNNICPDKI